MRRWNSLMPQGGLTRWCLCHAIPTTHAMTTTATAAAISMRTIRSRYAAVQDRAQRRYGVERKGMTRGRLNLVADLPGNCQGRSIWHH